MSDVGAPTGRTTAVCHFICGTVLAAEPGESIVVYLPVWRWLDHVVPTLGRVAEEYDLRMTRDNACTVILYDSDHSTAITFLVPDGKGVLRGRRGTIVDGLMHEYVDGGGRGESVDAWLMSLSQL